MKIAFYMDAGRSTLTLNGVTAPLRNSEDEKVAWQVIKLALFAKNPQYEIVRLLRTA